MAYQRSPMLNRSVTTDGQPLDPAVLTANRQHLVDQFNKVVGKPGAVIEAMQRDFILGNMPYDEMVSYVRFCEYMIDAAEAGEADSASQHTDRE